MLKRRTLLTGAALLPLATPAVHSFAAAPLTAHVITAFDDSASVYGPTFPATPPAQRIRAQHLRDWAKAMLDMPEIIDRSPFDYVDFSAFGWGEEHRPMIPPLRLTRGKCQGVCEDIAGMLLADIDNEGYIGGGNTKIAVALSNGLAPLQASPASQRVLNLVSDDDNARIEPNAYQAYRQRAIQQGIIINALVLGDPRGMNGYFYQVATGQVLKGTGPEVWRRKFTLDLS